MWADNIGCAAQAAQNSSKLPRNSHTLCQGFKHVAASIEETALRPLPETGNGLRAIRDAFNPTAIVAGRDYVSRCLRGHLPFGVITGSATTRSELVMRITADCAMRDNLHTVRIGAPTHSAQAFLCACLEQLAVELVEAKLNALHDLMDVFLRHESARGRRTVVIVENADHCGLPVFKCMVALAHVRAGTTPAITFILTGSPDLHRILDSSDVAGLRQLTRQRLGVDGLPSSAIAVPSPAAPHSRAPTKEGRVLQRSLAIILAGEVVERHELRPGWLMIGRSPKSGLCLDSRYVSRNHAALLVTRDDVVIVDLKSTNGTLVNGVAAVRQSLDHGDVLNIGNFRLRYDCRPE
jgi:hypothetical protein